MRSMRLSNHRHDAARLLASLLLLCIGSSAYATLSPPDPDRLLEELVSSESGRDPRAGVASYYASRFIGLRTTSGERYDPDKLTAAHATLPLGTVVRVHNDSTDQNVIVRINDRCHPRHASKNLIDLSRLAAKQIGLWGKGMIKVHIIPLKEGEEAMNRTLMQELLQ